MRTILIAQNAKYMPSVIAMDRCSLIRNISPALFEEWLRDGSFSEVAHGDHDICVLSPLYGDLITLKDYHLYRARDCILIDNG